MGRLDGMNQPNFENFIKNRYEPRVDWYDKKSIRNKRLLYLFQIPVLIFAAITPILAALGYITITIITSAIVAAGLGVLKFCKFESLWHTYRSTWEVLKREKVHHDMRTDIYSKADNIDKLFVERIENILQGEHAKWEETVFQNKSKNSA